MTEFERELILERTHAGRIAARANGKRPGRPPSMGPLAIKKAKGMLADRKISMESVAKQMGVRVSTLYRHIPGARSAVVEQP